MRKSNNNLLCSLLPGKRLVHLHYEFFSSCSHNLAGQLYSASYDGQDEQVLDLVKRGTDPNYYCTVHAASSYNHSHCIELLIQWGFDLGKRDDVNGRTALHEACANNHMASVRLLLEHHSPTGEPGSECC